MKIPGTSAKQHPLSLQIAKIVLTATTKQMMARMLLKVVTSLGEMLTREEESDYLSTFGCSSVATYEGYPAPCNEY